MVFKKFMKYLKITFSSDKYTKIIIKYNLMLLKNR